jgi:hypothetical protein
MEHYLREMIAAIDSSLLDEWERLRDPAHEPAERAAPQPTGPRDITRDTAGFRRAVRHEVFSLLAEVARGDWSAAANRLADSGPPPAEGMPHPAARALEARFAAYFEARGRFRLDPEGRSAENTHWGEPEAGLLPVSQVLVDPEGENDWELRLVVDLAASRERAAAVLRSATPAPIGA